MTFPPALSHNAMADPLPRTDIADNGDTDVCTLTECFNIFLRRLVPTPQAYANARLQAEDVVFALRRALYPLRMASSITGDYLTIGSVGKRTATAPISIVDVFYLLPTKLSITGPTEAHKAILAAAHDQYSPDQIKTDTIGVLIAAQSLAVRLIPAVETKVGYKFPIQINNGLEWRVSNPVSEAATLRLSDSLNDGATRRLLTLLKAWKQASHVAISSLVLEVLVQDYFASQPRQRDLATDFKMFAAWVRSIPQGSIKAAGSHVGIDVGDDWKSKAKAAYWRATLAEQTATNDLQKAALEWRHLLGMQFPVPEIRTSPEPPILEACA